MRKSEEGQEGWREGQLYMGSRVRGERDRGETRDGGERRAVYCSIEGKRGRGDLEEEESEKREKRGREREREGKIEGRG